MPPTNTVRSATCHKLFRFVILTSIRFKVGNQKESVYTNRNSVAVHLYKTAMNIQCTFFAVFRYISQRTCFQRRYNGCMLHQNSKRAKRTRQCYTIYFACEDFLFRRYNIQMQSFHLYSLLNFYFFACSSNFFPFSIASSIVPTFRKAGSGR